MSLKVKVLRILEREDYVPMTKESIAHTLKLKTKDFNQLSNLLAQLVEKGTLVELKNQRFCLASDADLVTGTIRFRASGAAILIPDALPAGEGREERPPLMIRREDTGLALNGDRVIARVERPKFRYIRRRKGKPTKAIPLNISEEKTLYGRVIRILERANNTIIGTYQKNKSFYYIIPDDPTFPQDVLVGPPEQYEGLIKPVPQDKVIVRLHDWTNRHLAPTGEVVEVLGRTHTPVAEFEAVLRKYKSRYRSSACCPRSS
jgi:ribonuclease R